MSEEKILKDYLAVSGKPGLYKKIATRSNGLIVSDLVDEKPIFVSVRKHQFTPLESIGIYTDLDSTNLIDIFETMRSNLEQFPLPSLKENKDVIFKYFENILPNYDKERVKISDVKKVIKWFKILNDKGILVFDDKTKSSQ